MMIAAAVASTAAVVGFPLPPEMSGAIPLLGRRVAFTTPTAYADRLTVVIERGGATPLSLPAVVVEPTPHTLVAIQPYVSEGALELFAAVAFTSRTGITAVSLALQDGIAPLYDDDSAGAFTVAALGKDAEFLHDTGLLSRLCRNSSRIKILVPKIASPAGLVGSLGVGFGRKILCPVPKVIDLEDPPVIPDFVRGLESEGWVVVRVPAYETRWKGPGCMEGLVGLDGALDAIIFTSSAEVEGMLKGLQTMGWDWGKVKQRWPEILVAAHGPVTAKGIERFGIPVDVVSSKFSSFDGVVEALACKLKALDAER